MGKRVHFSPQGDGPAHYTILNYQPSRRRQKLPSESDRSDYVVVGRWSEDALEINERLLFWNAMDGDELENEKLEISWKLTEPPKSVCSEDCPLGYKKQLIKEVRKEGRRDIPKYTEFEG